MTRTYIDYIDSLLHLLHLYIEYFGESDYKCKKLFWCIYDIFENDPELFCHFDISPYTDIYTVEDHM